jgi:hypothetical protein
VVTVVEALERDVTALGELPVGSEALVASAFALARELDDENSATSKSMCARALREAMAEIRVLAPTKPKADALDELANRRQTRRAKVKKAS